MQEDKIQLISPSIAEYLADENHKLRLKIVTLTEERNKAIEAEEAIRRSYDGLCREMDYHMGVI